MKPFKRDQLPAFTACRLKPSSPRTLILYTDASYRAATNSGAWAAILTGPNVKHTEISGPLKGEIGSSTSAEARAVANGLHHFIREKMIRPGDAVTIILDNRAVVDRLTGVSRRSRSPSTTQAITAIWELANKCNLTIKAEWVRGHAPLTVPHAAHNRRCDKLCGQHSRKLHRERLTA